MLCRYYIKLVGVKNMHMILVNVESFKKKIQMDIYKPKIDPQVREKT